MVRKTQSKNMVCPPDMQVIDAISGKWTVMVIYLLSDKTRRYSELYKVIPGISQKMLTQTLRNLERDGILLRKVYPVVPPQVEYSLTPLGESLVDLLSNLCTWSMEHYDEVEQARLRYQSSKKQQTI